MEHVETYGIFTSSFARNLTGKTGIRPYLPKEWTQAPARLDKAGVPKTQQGYRFPAPVGLGDVERYWVSAAASLGRR